MQRLTVSHKTVYRYSRPVMLGEHRLMYRPRDSHDLRLLDATILIKPQASLRYVHDVFGNSVAIAEFEGPADCLEITSHVVLDRYPMMAPRFPIEAFATVIPFSYPASEIPDLGRTIERHYPDPERKVTEWTRQFLSISNGSTETEAFLRTLTRCINQDFTYQERNEPGVQSPTETLKLGSGSCRDYALLMMEAVRSVGLAARFVSGYLYDPAIDGKASETVGAGATHAWVQVYLPGAGWLDFDPTNGCAGGQNLVPVAVAREPDQAMPVSGTFAGGASDFIEMTVEVAVRSMTVVDNVA